MTLGAPPLRGECHDGSMNVSIKRVYEKPDSDDGYRVLVDRLWPRGVAKANAAVDLWLREIGPSDELRKWFGHDPERFAEFATKYHAELDDNPAMQQLRELIASHGTVTLVYSAKDEEHNQAVVLAGYLR
jgi:DNA-3-methyladenine glycosylase